MINELNYLGQKRTPFIFIIDFDLKNYHIQPVKELDADIYFSIDGYSNISKKVAKEKSAVIIKKNPITFPKYKESFNRVIKELYAGNSYLLNLTFPTEIEINHSLYEIFLQSRAKFRLYYKDKFISFSPERFIEIEDNIVKTCPMKGTIDATIPDAEKIILNNEKEFAEHVTVVDLLRNDLSMISTGVRVSRFRYIDKIFAGESELLQVSSEITGDLDKDWRDRIGDMLIPLLPAGSITGAPKKKTVQMIKKIEGYNRGYYTGVFGYFDGNKLDSSVIIRYIEKQDNKLIYKSGGGITFDSDAESEYKELIDKVYIPI